MTQRNLMLQFFDELRVLIGRSFAEAMDPEFLARSLQVELALKKNGRELRPQNQGTLLGENRFIK